MGWEVHRCCYFVTSHFFIYNILKLINIFITKYVVRSVVTLLQTQKIEREKNQMAKAKANRCVLTLKETLSTESINDKCLLSALNFYK